MLVLSLPSCSGGVSLCLDSDFASYQGASATSHSHMVSPSSLPAAWRISSCGGHGGHPSGGASATSHSHTASPRPHLPRGGLAPVGAMLGTQCALPDPPQVLDMECPAPAGLTELWACTSVGPVWLWEESLGDGSWRGLAVPWRSHLSGPGCSPGRLHGLCSTGDPRAPLCPRSGHTWHEPVSYILGAGGMTCCLWQSKLHFRRLGPCGWSVHMRILSLGLWLIA